MATRERFTFRLANRIIAGLVALGLRDGARALCRLPAPDSIREFSARESRRAELIGRSLDERPSRRSARASTEFGRPFLLPVPAEMRRSSIIPLPFSTGAAEAKRMGVLARSCSLVLIGDLAIAGRGAEFGAGRTATVGAGRIERVRDALRSKVAADAQRIEGIFTAGAVVGPVDSARAI